MDIELQNKERLAKNIILPVKWTSPQIVLGHDGKTITLNVFTEDVPHTELDAIKLEKLMIEYLEAALGYKIGRADKIMEHHGNFADPDKRPERAREPIAEIDRRIIK